MAENGKPQDQAKSKLIVDDDWKTQAQAEKAKLAEQVDTEGGPAGTGDLPKADFSAIVGMLANQVSAALGAMADPETGRRYVDLGMAKLMIDMLAILEEKTKGNLTPEEKKLLDHSLYETRMAYVQIAQRVGT